jgi:hypothetical protein
MGDGFDILRNANMMKSIKTSPALRTECTVVSHRWTCGTRNVLCVSETKSSSFSGQRKHIRRMSQIAAWRHQDVAYKEERDTRPVQYIVSSSAERQQSAKKRICRAPPHIRLSTLRAAFSASFRLSTPHLCFPFFIPYPRLTSNRHDYPPIR